MTYIFHIHTKIYDDTYLFMNCFFIFLITFMVNFVNQYLRNQPIAALLVYACIAHKFFPKHIIFY